MKYSCDQYSLEGRLLNLEIEVLGQSIWKVSVSMIETPRFWSSSTYCPPGAASAPGTTPQGVAPGQSSHVLLTEKMIQNQGPADL